MEIIFEDNHLLVVNKPAGWIVQGAAPGQKNLLVWAADYLREKYNKPGNVFVGVVSRLDAPVSGVMPLARTSKAASRLSEQFRNQSPNKTYWAIVEECPPQHEDRIEHNLIRAAESTVTRVGRDSDPNGKRSILEYRVVGENPLGYEVEIHLITGRKHQIRCQMQAIGCPIVGDAKYGSTKSFPEGIALHCRQLQLEHPTLKTECTFEAKLPGYWHWQSD